VLTLTPPKPVVKRPSLIDRIPDPDRRAAIRELVSITAAKSACNSLIRNAEEAGNRRLLDDLLALSMELARQKRDAWDRVYPVGRAA
jgi:hypothetical protein